MSVPNASPPAVTRREVLILMAILVLAVVLRSVGLDWPLWYDEIDTLKTYIRLPTSELVTTYDSLNNHMLFSLEAQGVVALFGESNWAIRLPAMLMGVGSIWALWRLARSVVTPTEALFAAGLMAVSYHHVWFSQNARGYTGLLFFGLLATHALLQGARTQGWRPWIAYGVLLAASMYTHLSAAFFFFAQGLAYLALLIGRGIAGRGVSAGDILRPLGGVALGLVVVALLYLPVLGQMVDTFSGVQAGNQNVAHAEAIAEWKNPLWTIREILAGLGPLLGLAAPVILLVLGIASVSIWRRAALVPLVLFFHFGATTVLLLSLGFRIWPRYFLIDIGLICLLLIHGAFVIGGWLAPRIGQPPARTGAILAAIGVAASLILLPRNYTAPKQDFEGAARLIAAERAPDAVVIAPGISYYALSYYLPDARPAITVEDFKAAFDPTRETWIVYSFPAVTERRHDDFLSLYRDEFKKVRYFPGTLAGGGTVVLRRPGDG
ncbi:MAG: glycosyltransferase family 39 protein [Marinibacterium sp.]